MPKEKTKAKETRAKVVQQKTFPKNIKAFSGTEKVLIGDIDIRKIEELDDEKFQVNTFVIQDKEQGVNIAIEDSQRVGKYEPISKAIVFDDKEGIITQTEISKKGDIVAETSINITSLVESEDKPFVVPEMDIPELPVDQVEIKFRKLIADPRNDNPEVKAQFSLAELRTLSKKFDVSTKSRKDEKLNLVRKLRRKLE